MNAPLQFDSSSSYCTSLCSHQHIHTSQYLKGPYLAAHVRRSDFFYAHKDVLPKPEHTVAQFSELISNYSLTAVFVASDARPDDDEFFGMEDLAPIKYVRYPGGKGLANKLKSKPKFGEGL